MSLALLFEDSIVAILQAKQGDPSPAQAIFDSLDSVAENAQAKGLGYTKASIDSGKLAVAALGDSVLLKKGIASGLVGLVDDEKAGTISTVFYEKFRELKKDPNLRSDRLLQETLEIYCLCLLLGFEGDNPPNSKKEITAAKDLVEDLMGAKPALSVGSMYFKEPATSGYDKVARALFWSIPIGCVLIVLWLFVFHLMGRV